MAREWSLEETKALVEEHIALKEEEKAEVRTASEHWNKVAKKLREKGFNRSHKSCNKRWYRLEQAEVQIFSFNMEEGNKSKNFWDLTRAERLEFRSKWPQLPSGDGIDREIFDMLKQISQRCEKKDTVVESEAVETKEVVVKAEYTTRPPQPSPPQPQPVIQLLPTPPTPALVPEAEAPKQQVNMWPEPSLTSQDALDGFKLQARELRRRRAAELRRNNRVVPYSNTHTTFMKATTTTGPPAPLAETTPFDFTNPPKPSFQLKRPNPFAYAAGSKSSKAAAGAELESVNAHMPLLQPQDGHNIMAELEEQLQMILGADKPAASSTHVDSSHQGGGLQFRRALVDPPGALAAVGGLGAQLGAIVKLLQAKQVAEQEFRDKILVLVECMAVSMRSMAQANTRI